ncbi:hypothetical protein XENOCAPTIV_026535, partial [Xenoophorus captivus]
SLSVLSFITSSPFPASTVKYCLPASEATLNLRSKISLKDRPKSFARFPTTDPCFSSSWML